MGDALGDYWEEYQSGNDATKAEIIGRVITDAALVFVPGGALAKLGTGTVKAGAVASKASKAAGLLTSAASKLNFKSKFQFKDLADWAGDSFTTIVGNESGHVSNLIGKYKPPPKSLKAFSNARRAKKKTRNSSGGLRARWKDNKGNIYEWDSQHGKVEKYDKRGKHLGEFDPTTGNQTKPSDNTRRVEP